MTNIVAAITFAVVTNWTTVSKTEGVCNRPGCLAIHIPTLNQQGARVTNTVALVVWKGKTNEVILESTEPFWTGELHRSIAGESPWSRVQLAN